MHFPRVLITLLAMIAQAHGGTLRQYSRDWLIPKPEPQVGSKRITAKSVFITPTFPQNVRCVTGYQEDASGRCVKLVHVNQVAQLDFLLQRLNAMYGAPVVSHSEKQPLQVAVEIPVEPTDADLLDETAKPVKEGEMYGRPAPTLGEMPASPVFIDVVSKENSTKEEDHKASNAGDFITNKTSASIDSNKESQNITSTEGSDEFPVYVEEDPIVSITIIDSDEEGAVVNHTGEDVQATDNSTEKMPDRLISIMDESQVADEEKVYTSKIIKKETAFFNNSAEDMPPKLDVFELNSNQTVVDTSVEQKNATKPLSNMDIVVSDNDGIVLNSTLATVMANEGNTLDDTIIDSSTDESTNEIKSNGSKLEDTFMLSAVDSTTSDDMSVTVLSTFQVPTTMLPILVTGNDFEEATELGEKIEVTHSGSGDDYVAHEVDLEVDYDKEYYMRLKESSSVKVQINGSATHHSEVASGEIVNGNVKGSDIFDSESDVGNEGESLHETDGQHDQEVGGSVVVRHDGSLVNSYIDTKVNRTHHEVLSVKQTVKNDASDHAKPFKIDLGYLDDSSTHLESASVNAGVADSLKFENTNPQIFVESVPSVSQHSEVRPDSSAPLTGVHVVYPQPVFQVPVKQESLPQSIIEPIPTSQLKESVDFHPNPLQVHNLSPQDQMPTYMSPLVEKAPESPPKYGGFAYPPLPPLPESRPHRPQHHHHHHQNHNVHSSFVRFPADPVHSQPQTYLHSGNQDEEVNTVRFPHDDGRNNDKYSRWGGQQNNNWRFDERRNHRPEQRFWPGRQETQHSQQGTNRRNYWVGNYPSRRRQQPNFH